MSHHEVVVVGGPLEGRRVAIRERALRLRNHWANGAPTCKCGETPETDTSREYCKSCGETPMLVHRPGDNGETCYEKWDLHVGCGEMCPVLASVPYDGDSGAADWLVAEAIAHAGRDLLDLDRALTEAHDERKAALDRQRAAFAKTLSEAETAAYMRAREDALTAISRAGDYAHRMEAERDAARDRANDLANRCMGSEGVLQAIIDRWDGTVACHEAMPGLIEEARAALAPRPTSPTLSSLPVEGRAVVDPPGTATTNAAVDGGGDAGGVASADPGSLSEVADGLGDDAAGKGPAASNLRDLVEEARDLAKHLLDQGECPECHGGECAPCKGFGYVDGPADDDPAECATCKGEGAAPHMDGCRLATFPDRAMKALS